VVEGSKLFEEAIRSEMRMEEAFLTQEALSANGHLLQQLEAKKIPVNRIASRLAKLVSDLETPPGLTAIIKKPQSGKAMVRRIAVFLVGLRDPGNVGTIIRTAEGTGCDAVFYTDCADPFQPKVVRASMGSIFRVPLIEVKNPLTFLKQKNEEQIPVCGLVSVGGLDLREWTPSFPTLVCVGSESHGLPAEFPLTSRISIPMDGEVESLNAAIAASVCLYWIHLKCRNRN
jgi:TrmH family RNA methyltransferase